MGNAMKIVLLAVTVIIVAVLIVAAFSLVNTGQGLLSTGKSQVSNAVKDYGEAAYTQYDGSIVAGSQVIGAIKTEWKENNTISVLVCTKDGKNYFYDYSGNQYKTCTTDSNKADGEAICKNLSNGAKSNNSLKSNNLLNTSAVTSITKDTNESDSSPASKVSGYNEGASTSTSGYITRDANFKGAVSRDQNGNIRLVTFIQQ